ncbi:hypothetical protein SMACR_02112 [Sordaria macrospora]|uniref:WGS project CABT00000000 data, contig 2.18 n=2 Tax=Sordaria macrospora TaxID=5147 RepID=F7W103_SORMK|nr:uncharacterized protein SMAC_02112 [Sordaria macrospora k-hell]KAA8629651.1 hypothetical protein SMACR_02112 [Sordaria macrospora]KAH7629191.1 hypothetical protein B0T09DRAFT_400616 [Sordaria sp. MPI-SDFR-AT-0083]WPJ63801.1 hypothetical protein SMAC4_02112 [Sordaria macrospora]CCC11455.1 unnamed protein product [Sordaria macrospora k-hell]
MSIIRHRSRIRPSRARLRTPMKRITIEPLSNMLALRACTNRPPTKPIMVCRNIMPRPIILIRSSQIRATWADIPAHDTWVIPDRLTLVDQVLRHTLPEDLDLTIPGISDLEQNDLDSMQQSSLGAAYAQAAAAPPQHHHHRLPDTGPPNKLLRREGEGSSGGGAPSVVGQAGMPPPAPRPRGPKLKFTPEDDQLLIDLKENKNLTWKQIADFFPGRSSGTLQVRYCTKLKAKTTQWTDETDQKLKTALQDYENEKWRIVANKVGTGFTPVACRERAAQLMGENL